MKVTLENVMFVVACLFMVYALYLAYVLFRMYMGFRRLATEDKVKKVGGEHTLPDRFPPDWFPQTCADQFKYDDGRMQDQCPCIDSSQSIRFDCLSMFHCPITFVIL
jgi:hypothetical protein